MRLLYTKLNDFGVKNLVETIIDKSDDFKNIFLSFGVGDDLKMSFFRSGLIVVEGSFKVNCTPLDSVA